MGRRVENSAKEGKNDKLIKQAVKNAQSIEHNVEILENLEKSIQSSYLAMRSIQLSCVCSKTD